MVTRVIYQDSKPTAKIRKKSPDLLSPAEQERHCNLHHNSPCSLTTLLPPHHHAGLLGSRTSLSDHSTRNTAPTVRKALGSMEVVLSSHPIQSPNPHPSSSNVISSSHGGLIEGPTRTLHRHRAPLGRRHYLSPAAYRVAGARGRLRQLHASHGSQNTVPKYYFAPGIYCPSQQPPGFQLWGIDTPWGKKPLPPLSPYLVLSSDTGPSRGAHQSNWQQSPRYLPDT